MTQSFSFTKLIYNFPFSDSIHTSNPFTNLSNIVSALTAIGHLDVYSLSRESLQRMLPAPPTNGSSSTSIGIKLVPRDDRRFQYRFSMKFVRALPEAQRPVEREIFGTLHAFRASEVVSEGEDLQAHFQCSSCNIGEAPASSADQLARMWSCE